MIAEPSQFRRRGIIQTLDAQLADFENNPFIPRAFINIAKTMRSLIVDYDQRITALENDKAPIL